MQVARLLLLSTERPRPKQPPRQFPLAAGYFDSLQEYLAASPHRLAQHPQCRAELMRLFGVLQPDLPSPETADPAPPVRKFCQAAFAQLDAALSPPEASSDGGASPPKRRRRSPQ